MDPSIFVWLPMSSLLPVQGLTSVRESDLSLPLVSYHQYDLNAKSCLFSPF